MSASPSADVTHSSRQLPSPGASLWLLIRCRFAQLRNLLDQQLREAPWRTLAIIVLLMVVWGALYLMLSLMLRHLRSWEMEGAIADQHIFIHFFLVLAVMLAFSNAILTFSSLYGRNEAAYLLSMPVYSRHVVCVKWLEGMLLSSWSFMLLGVPLMLAVASTSTVRWYYYPLFLAHFMGFVAIPACLGLLAAWVVAMWAPRRPMVVAISIGAVMLVAVILWFAHISRQAVESTEWLKIIFQQFSIAKQPYFPSTWTARGIVMAMNQRVDQSLFYLGVVLGNAAFLSWVTVNVLGGTWSEAYSRAQQGRTGSIVRKGWFSAAVSRVFFWYLPEHLWLVMLKDVRGFIRDPKQWSQMAIMFGLLVIYVLNLPRLPIDIKAASIKHMIAVLNLTTISLILATFTSRFVFPLLSMEGQQLWLIGLLPVRRGALLFVKFLFAFTVTGISGGGVMLLAVKLLDLPPEWGRMHVLICLGICAGLSGLAIGLGARFPVIGERNPARVAAGFGGTLNLIASMLFVVFQMTVVALMSLREAGLNLRAFDSVNVSNETILFGLLITSALCAALALFVGGRHFARLEI